MKYLKKFNQIDEDVWSGDHFLPNNEDIEGSCPDCEKDVTFDQCYGGTFECKCGRVGQTWELKKIEKPIDEKLESEPVQMYSDFTIVSDYILDPVFFGEFVWQMRHNGSESCISQYTSHPSYLSMNEVNTLVKYVFDSKLSM